MDAVAPEPPRIKPPATPLLPPFLLGPVTFLWLWVLPICVLLALNVQGYWLIEGNMSEAQRASAWILGGCGAADALLGFLLFFVAQRQNQSGDPRPAWLPVLDVAAVLAQVAYLWLALGWADQILPASVTAWIYPPERYLFNQFSFAMLPLFFGIFRLACARPAGDGTKVFIINLGMAAGAPVLLYVCFFVLRSLTNFGPSGGVFIALEVIGFGLVMFVALVRALMLGLRGALKRSPAGEMAAIGVFALILPVAGLLLNRTIPFPVDFQAWEVYALVGANTAILLIASANHERSPRISFHLLCATFPFSLYFFVVFLPFTPLSILAVLALGLGFLVLTPTILFTLHVYLLNQAWRNPRLAEQRGRVLLFGLLFGLTLPAFFTVRGLADKAALNAALDYVYAPAIGTKDLRSSASLGNLRRAIDSHRHYKNGIYYPLLSDYYAWLVFDNLVLPDEKLNRIEAVFFGSARQKGSRDPVRQPVGFWGSRDVRTRAHMPRAAATPQNAGVARLEVNASSAGQGISTLTLRVALQSPDPFPNEFVKAIPLPAGVYVSGFRLRSRGVTVPGKIFEKKTALWTYAMIRDSERKDPGLLFYNKPGELELRVFPITLGAPMEVEMDFLIPGTISVQAIDPTSRDIGEVLAQASRNLPLQVVTNEHGSLAIADALDSKFPAFQRDAYLELLVDCSGENGFEGELAAAVRRLKGEFPLVRLARVTLVNYDVVDFVTPLTPIDRLAEIKNGDLRRVLQNSGGFVLDLALAHALRRHQEVDLDQWTERRRIPPRPIFVILSRQASARKIDLGIAGEWTDVVPDVEVDELDQTGRFTHQLHMGQPVASLLRLGESIRPSRPGLAPRFKPVHDRAALEYWSPESGRWMRAADAFPKAPSTPWSRAVALQFQQQDYSRSPGDSDLDLEALVRASREAGVLLASTSYIVVENSAQWRMLELSERQKIGQNAALDFLETPAPPGVYVGAAFVLSLVWRHWRRRGNLATPVAEGSC